MKVVFDNPDEPMGAIFDFGGIALPNATAVSITEAERVAFYLRTGRTLEQAIADSVMIKLDNKKSEVK